MYRARIHGARKRRAVDSRAEVYLVQKILVETSIEMANKCRDRARLEHA